MSTDCAAIPFDGRDHPDRTISRPSYPLGIAAVHVVKENVRLCRDHPCVLDRDSASDHVRIVKETLDLSPLGGEDPMRREDSAVECRSSSEDARREHDDEHEEGDHGSTPSLDSSNLANPQSASRASVNR